MALSPARNRPFKGRELILIWSACACLLQAPVVQGEDYTCRMEMNGTCITNVKWNIPQNYADEGRPFTVSFESTQGKTEDAVVLHYFGYYYCEAAGGHVCDEATNSTFVVGNSVTSCVTGRNYSLAADGGGRVPCEMEQIVEIHKERTTAESSDCTQAPQTNTLAIVAGVGLPLLTTAVGILVYCLIRRFRQKNWLESSESSKSVQPMLEVKEKVTSPGPRNCIV